MSDGSVKGSTFLHDPLMSTPVNVSPEHPERPSMICYVQECFSTALSSCYNAFFDVMKE
jgi:hypothetical protein